MSEYGGIMDGHAGGLGYNYQLQHHLVGGLYVHLSLRIIIWIVACCTCLDGIYTTIMAAPQPVWLLGLETHAET